MERLAQSDLDKVQVFLRETAIPCDLATFSSLILPAVQDLVPGDVVCLSESEEASQKSVTFEVYPEGAHMDTELFDLFMFDHPVFQFWADAPESPTVFTSQVTSMSKWHHTALYQEVYRPLGLEDSLSVALPAPPGLVSCICIERSRRFSDRDRAILEMVRPYLAQLYRNAEMLSLLDLAGDGNGSQHIVVDEAGNPVTSSRHAWDLIHKYFPWPLERPRTFPRPLGDWLRHQLACYKQGRLSRPPSGLTSDPVEGGTLKLRVMVSARSPDQALLLLREHLPPSMSISPEWGLSDREKEVLSYARQGLRNAEIAGRLDISRRTVEKHFENVFCKLGVESRGAALARAFLDET